ncbi:MFS transporter [Sphaerisporangium sp. B11E5]|uniref:MFS transporter n=1 Tax=Sphaerisporangium sp. B11E5 TaxID=3153563 RepID=UPI00325EAF04
MPVPSLRRDRDFLRFWAGQTASQFGGQITQLTVPLTAVVALGAGSEQVGLLRAVQQVPIFLFALFVGVWVDRWRGRGVMLLADGGRALALAVVPLAYAFDALGVATLYVAGFFVGIFTIFFDVAYQAYLLRLVDREQLIQGNSMLESTRSAAQIGGPSLGGGLVTLLTAPVAVAAGPVLFAVSFLSIWRIRRPESVPSSAGRREGMVRQIREGLVVVGGDAALRAVALVSGAFNFALAAFMTVYLIFLPRELGLSGAAVGLCLAALGPGALVGSLLSARLPRLLGYGVLLLAASAVSDAMLLGVAAVHGSGIGTIALLMAINFLFGALAQTVNVAVTSIRQAITPDAYQGRVSATVRFAALGFAPLGSLLGGYLGDAAGLRPAVFLTALALFLSPLFMSVSPLARLGRRLPGPAAA